MKRVVRVNVISFAKVFSLMFLVVGVFYAVLGLVTALFSELVNLADIVLVLLLIPVIYLIIGGVVGFLVGFIYNLISRFVGGLEIELTDKAKLS